MTAYRDTSSLDTIVGTMPPNIDIFIFGMMTLPFKRYVVGFQLDRCQDVSLGDHSEKYLLSQNCCIVTLSLSWATYHEPYHIVGCSVIPTPNWELVVLHI